MRSPVAGSKRRSGIIPAPATRAPAEQKGSPARHEESEAGAPSGDQPRVGAGRGPEHRPHPSALSLVHGRGTGRGAALLDRGGRFRRRSLRGASSPERRPNQVLGGLRRVRGGTSLATHPRRRRRHSEGDVHHLDAARHSGRPRTSCLSGPAEATYGCDGPRHRCCAGYFPVIAVDVWPAEKTAAKLQTSPGIDRTQEESTWARAATRPRKQQRRVPFWESGRSMTHPDSPRCCRGTRRARACPDIMIELGSRSIKGKRESHE